ncbi:ABC transporter permease [Paenibacillus thermotolerans]|uniref:ABC transporter permease n=1 Tax=Paenibacillus thermotolerans TaxID=3027807 RepID=UPI00308263DC
MAARLRQPFDCDTRGVRLQRSDCTALGTHFAKFALTAAMLAAAQLLFLTGLLLIGLVKGYPAPIPWDGIGRSVFGGWVACLPLAALQLAVSTAWSSFAAPMAVDVIFTLPNILVVNSAKYGPYYPWAQPMLAMASGGADSFGAFNVPLETLLIVILGSFLLFFVSGLVYFQRRSF